MARFEIKSRLTFFNNKYGMECIDFARKKTLFLVAKLIF